MNFCTGASASNVSQNVLHLVSSPLNFLIVISGNLIWPVVVIMGVDTTGVVPVGVVTVTPALVITTGALVVVPPVVSVVDAAPVVLAVVVALVVVVADGLVGSSNAPAVPEGELGRLVCLPSASSIAIIAS